MYHEDSYHLYIKIFNEKVDSEKRKYFYNLAFDIKDNNITTVNGLCKQLNIEEPMKKEYYMELIKGYCDSNSININKLTEELAYLFACIEYNLNIHHPYIDKDDIKINKIYYFAYSNIYLKLIVRDKNEQKNTYQIRYKI